MKNFVTSLIVVIAIIAVIVLIKRITGDDEIVPGTNTESSQNISGEVGEVLPQ
jgi:hypothetical protein